MRMMAPPPTKTVEDYTWFGSSAQEVRPREGVVLAAHDR
jgi:hypothetical protein